jgi:hypothetical protein
LLAARRLHEARCSPQRQEQLQRVTSSNPDPKRPAPVELLSRLRALNYAMLAAIVALFAALLAVIALVFRTAIR